MRITYIFILLIVANINAQTSYNKIVNHIKVASTIPLIAWGSKEINIFPIPDIDLPAGMFEGPANTELDNAISVWSSSGYTFTRNTGLDPDNNAYEGVRIGFTVNKDYFVNSGLDPKNTHGIAFTALSKVAKDNYYIVYNNQNYPLFDVTFIVLNNTYEYLQVDPDLELVSYPVYSGNCPGIFQDPVHLQSVIIHELGHIFGLSHNNNINSVMYPGMGPCEMYTTLDSDDDLTKLIDIIDDGFPTNPCSPPLHRRKHTQSKIIEQVLNQ